ncbi:MAG: GNAT family N-acetyltransferase [Actinomycetota bacterium]
MVVEVRAGTAGDLAQINAIYNHYIRTSHCTFDVDEHDMVWRAEWFRRFAAQRRYRLMVASGDGRVLGFATTGPYRDRRAYDTSVETSVYVAHDSHHSGIGSLLYPALFAAIEQEDVHRAYAGIALPNDASVRLHEKMGFRRVAMFSEQGRKFGRYWDVAWFEKPLPHPAQAS